MEKIVEFLKQFGVLVVVEGVGCGILIYGLWEVVKPEGSVVEIVSENSVNQQIGETVGQIVVDVAGAVEKPGLYKLTVGSRIGDVLVMAGGLAANADREWVAKTVNLAEVVKDGGKIYIPRQSENSDNQAFGKSENQNGKVNINTASLGKLDGLVGIGEVRAQAIIDNRPYGSSEELVSKAKIPEGVYEKIKDQVSVY